MPGWSQDDVDLRDLRVFGQVELARPAVEKPAKDVPESLIELECCRLLAQDGWRILKTDPVSSRARGKGFGQPGMADTLAIRYGNRPAAEIAWFEWKAPGGRVRKHQSEWHIKERARGAMTAIAGVDFVASVQGFRSWYSASGLARAGWNERTS